jgi:dephospho-CoA kinase
MHKFSIGLTGGIGSGKSLVADLFAKRGAAIIDTDVIAHHLTMAGGAANPAIAAAFGPEFIAANGAMDRTAMRKKVFADPDARKRLELILHPLIGAETSKAAAQAQGPYLIYVVPLLVESGRWRDKVDRILVVDCSTALQLERVMRRNELAKSEVQAILDSQASRNERLAVADDIIINEHDLTQLESAVDELHNLYLRLAAKK